MSGAPQPTDKNRGAHRTKSRRGTGASRGVKSKEKSKSQEAPEEREVVCARKVVVRNLPLNFTKALFLQHVSPLPEYSYFAFHGPDPALANQGRCRAYIRFRNEEDVATFKEKFDGYIFLDSRGHELRCMVEMAPYQRTAIQNQEKADLKCGDIVNSPEYKQFLESLEKKKDQPPTSNSAKVQANLAALEKNNQAESIVTPLMEYLQTGHAEEEMSYRRSAEGRKADKARIRLERLAKKGAADRLDYPENAGLSGSKEYSRSTKSRGKDVGVKGILTKSAGKPQRDDGPPVQILKPVGAPSSIQNSGSSASEPERGRHFFSERPSPAKSALPDNPDKVLVDRRPQSGVKATVGKAREDFYRVGGDPERIPPRKGKADFYGPKPVASTPRTEDRMDKYGRVPPTPPNSHPKKVEYGQSPGQPPKEAQDSVGRPPRSVVSATNLKKPESSVKAKDYGDSRPNTNPITGGQEFGRDRQPEVKPPELTSSTTTAAPAGDIPQDGAARVPNRARPAVALYQPRGKRRYQN